jgi:predicted permease
MLNVLFQILPLFTIIGFGWFIAKIKLASHNWLKPIGDFSYYIGFPSLIFYNLVEISISPEIIEKAITHNTSLIFALLFLLFLCSLLFNISKKNKATLLLCFMFGNIAFMGIPIITSLNPSLKQEATVNASIYLFWVFSVGILAIEWLTMEKSNYKKTIFNLLTNPLLISVIIGLTTNFASLKLPVPILIPIKLLGNTVAPLVMLMIGIFMFLNPIKNLKELKNPLIYSIIKLLIFPIIVIITLDKIHLEEQFFTAIIDIAMPCAITPFALANIYDLNKRFISNSIIISTSLSIITLTIIIGLIG